MDICAFKTEPLSLESSPLTSLLPRTLNRFHYVINKTNRTLTSPAPAPSLTQILGPLESKMPGYLLGMGKESHMLTSSKQ